MIAVRREWMGFIGVDQFNYEIESKVVLFLIWFFRIWFVANLFYGKGVIV